MKKLLVFCFLYTNVSFSQQAKDITGLWFNEEKTAKIEVFEENGKFYGKILWLKEPTQNGQARTDINNPDEGLRSRPLLGLRILKDFEFDETEWEDGTIYDPKSGNTYSCLIAKEGENLEVTGYIGFSFIGKTTTWTPANSNL